MSTKLPGNVIIRASAGSGKTFQLSNRFLDLILRGEPFESILASTFTKKAAGEILDRILIRLAKATQSEKDLNSLSENLELERELRRDEVLELLKNLVHSLHQLRIGTLDSFFIRIAQSFAFELQLPPGWSILEPNEDKRLLSDAIRRVLENTTTADAVRLMHCLSKGEVTRSITEQMYSLAQNLLTLFRDSPPDSWNRLQKRTALSQSELQHWIGILENATLPKKKDNTLDSRFSKAREKDLQRTKDENWSKFLKDGLGSKVVDGTFKYYNVQIVGDLEESLSQLVEHAKATLINQVAIQTEVTAELLAHISEQYEQVKLNSRLMRFDDVTFRLTDPLLEHKLEQIVYRMDASTQHLLLDEFQDTSPVQWEVLRPFVHTAIQSTINSKIGSFFCVGDEKQAIYGWRGGVAEIFQSIEREIRPLTTEGLHQSWRSAPPIIKTVNELFGRLENNPVFSTTDDFERAAKNWGNRFEQHKTARKELSGYCTLETAPLFDPNQDIKRSEEECFEEFGLNEWEIEDDWFDSDDSDSASSHSDPENRKNDLSQKQTTLRFAIEQIDKLHRQAPGASLGVLVRKNKTVAAIISGLKKRGVEASEEGGNPLTDSPAVGIVLSALTFADHPGDSICRFHLANSPLGPFLGLTPDLLDELNQLEQLDQRNRPRNRGQANLFEDNLFQENLEPIHLDSIEEDEWNEEQNTERRVELEQELDRISRSIRDSLFKEGYGTVIAAWIRQLAPSCDQQGLDRLLQLLTLAYSWESQASSRADRFVEMVRMTRIESPSDAKIRVMTIHQSKGLQFDIVVLPELEDRLIGQSPSVVVSRKDPDSGKPDPTGPIHTVLRFTNKTIQQFLPESFQQMFGDYQTQQIEESLCLLYVAMTRAIHRLVMIIPPLKPTKTKPSPRKTFDGILRCGLKQENQEDVPSSVLYENGDPNWLDRHELLIWTSERPTPKSVAIRLEEVVVPRRNIPRIKPSDAKFGATTGTMIPTTSTTRKPETTTTDATSTTPTRTNATTTPPSTLRTPTQTPTNKKTTTDKTAKRPTAHINHQKTFLDLSLSENEAHSFSLMQESDAKDKGENNSDSSALSPLLTDSSRNASISAAFWGTLIHLCFEKGFAENPWLDQPQFSEETLKNLKQLIDQKSHHQVSSDQILEEFLESCSKPAIRDILSRKTYERNPQSNQLCNPNWKVIAERPVLVRTQSGIISGSIDRLVLILDGEKVVGADVLDFKTDRYVLSRDGSLEEFLVNRSEQYYGQLRTYKEAVARLYRLPLQNIHSAILFTSPGQVCRLD
ncbi:MAG: UvrD-helicase domain-containing protein [Thermoguttaceae bacterium]